MPPQQRDLPFSFLTFDVNGFAAGHRQNCACYTFVSVMRMGAAVVVAGISFLPDPLRRTYFQFAILLPRRPAALWLLLPTAKD